MKNIDNKILYITMLCCSIIVATFIIANALITFKKLDRSVIVKGFSEREYQADTVIWPIGFSETSNNVTELYSIIEKKRSQIYHFLTNKGITSDTISISTPQVIDRESLTYNDGKSDFRYVAKQYLTVYSTNIILTRTLISKLPELGKQGIVFLENSYDNPIEYFFSQLNDVKPEMIEESTKDARAAAIKFAKDSQSRLGKIKKASQGLFSINSRDKNNPHIKKIRVVSTIEYYLID